MPKASWLAWNLPAKLSLPFIPEVSYKAINGWALWTGASVLVSSGLLSFAFQWRSVAKSFKALSGLFGKKGEQEKEPLAEVECPPTWFPLGFLVLGPVVVALMAYLFQIPWWAGVLALPLSVVMDVIASRVTGGTDTTPTKQAVSSSCPPIRPRPTGWPGPFP